MLKEVELEPEYIGEEEYAADIDWEGADGLVEFDEEVLMEVAEDGAGGHAWVMMGVLMSMRRFIGKAVSVRRWSWWKLN